MYQSKFLRPLHYIDPTDDNISLFSDQLSRLVCKKKRKGDSMILLCIGTDKITGDCLGPLVGTKLTEAGINIPLFGTLREPIHASNLSNILPIIYRKYRHPFFLVVDASVGAANKVGMVTYSSAPLFPGRGIKKTLPPIGEISVTGIVAEYNLSVETELPYTRLYLVDYLARFISLGLEMCFSRIEQDFL